MRRRVHGRHATYTDELVEPPFLLQRDSDTLLRALDERIVRFIHQVTLRSLLPDSSSCEGFGLLDEIFRERALREARARLLPHLRPLCGLRIGGRRHGHLTFETAE